MSTCLNHSFPISRYHNSRSKYKDTRWDDKLTNIYDVRMANGGLKKYKYYILNSIMYQILANMIIHYIFV